MAVSSTAQAQAWEPVAEEEGIKVWQRTVAGTSLVEFRGRGVIQANLKDILAVMHDHKRKTEWLDSCSVNQRLRAMGAGRNVIYNRTDSGFIL